MSTKTLSTAASDAIKAVQTSQGTNEAVKETLITEIVSLYQTHPDVTPEHLILGDYSKGFIGRAYAAWYVHKASVQAVDMNITFISANHASIMVKDNAEAMTQEFARVAKEIRDAKRVLADADALSGKALNEALTEASEYLDKVSKKVLVPSLANDALIMTLRAKIATLTANYNAVIEAQRKEAKTLVTTN
jgi:hypothetical protein